VQGNAKTIVMILSNGTYFFTGKLILIVGYNWSQGLDYEKLLASYLTSGFQATSFGLAVQEVNKMVITKKSE